MVSAKQPLFFIIIKSIKRKGSNKSAYMVGWLAGATSVVSGRPDVPPQEKEP